MTHPSISAIVCTYNPSTEILARCLKSIADAHTVFPILELIIVDNNSSFSFNSTIEIALEGKIVPKIISEIEQGLTAARLRGINEAQGSEIVFIDDDNFLKSDFFLKGSEIIKNYPFIGSFSGQVLLQFEEKPPSWTERYWGLLVYRKFSGNIWSNIPHLASTMPCGAGLFVKMSVAMHYVELHRTGKRFIKLDRCGDSLISGGDNDLAACACDIGLGVGLFSDLILTHFIPKRRLELNYLVSLTRAISFSSVILKSFRGEYIQRSNWKRRIADNIRMLLMDSISRKFFRATIHGENDGIKTIENNLFINHKVSS
jgi:glycosyltransferase involved in cell wall biosynthesis